jgi:RNA polymerase sigma-70 factor (ECF subfamily)
MNAESTFPASMVVVAPAGRLELSRAKERGRVSQGSAIPFCGCVLMSELTSSFRSLMQEIAAGSQTAVGKLLDLYGHHLCRAVRRRLNRVLRPKYDTSDFVQAVWASFFCHREQLAQFEHSAQLVAFLTRVANNKVIDECRHHRAKKADVARETSLSGEGSQEIPCPSREPAPSQVAIAREQWGRMTDEVQSEYQQILQLRFAGETQEEIARRLGVSEKTVRRVLNRLRNRLEKKT